MIELIALISMVVDHIGIIFFPEMIIFQILGRLSFPAYAYFIALGFNRSTNISYYFFRVLFLGIVSQVIYYNLLSQVKLNICFTLAFGIFFLIIVQNTKITIFYKVALCIIIMIIVLLSGCEYGVYGVTTIYFFYRYINSHKYLSLIFGLFFINFLSVFIFFYSQNTSVFVMHIASNILCPC